ncbi:hypothetical protein Trydic_g22741 [Trypoxylus dichotomus]
MSKNRFATLLIALCFDNPADRAKQRQNDLLASISEVFNKFAFNSQSVYSLGTNTMKYDEMLIPFRGRCRYKMCMPSKPCKYGFEIMCLADARNHYFCDGYLYCGKTDGIGLTEE